MPVGIFLTPGCLQIIEGHTSYQGAWKSYDTIRKMLGKKPRQKITIADYCSSEGCTAAEVLQAFEKKKN